MKLKSFRIINYRSIRDSSTIQLNQYNVIVGKNNEGKSNVVSALRLALSFLDSRRFRYDRKISYYKFSEDYPVCLMEKTEKYFTNHPTTITLEFLLSNEESRRINKNCKVWLIDSFFLQVTYTKSGVVTWKFLRKQFNSDSLKVRAVLRELSFLFPLTFIETIRTDRLSANIIQDIISRKLLVFLENDSEYNEALSIIRNKEANFINNLCSDILPTLQKFVPEIKNISFNPEFERTSFYDTNYSDFEIDDGVKTSFYNKGDGIKSLLQIALLKFNSSTNTGLLVIEEPEAHLHSGAIHELFGVLRTISSQQQTLLTSHNPIFVNAEDISSNIVVDSNTCKQARNIAEIRKILGVEISDSLFLSDFVVLVEGLSDKILFNYIFNEIGNSCGLDSLLKTKKICIQECGGAGNIESTMSYLSSIVVKFFAIYDNDQSGLDAYDNALKRSFLIPNNYYILVGKPKKTEIEDLIKFEYCSQFIIDTYSVDIRPYKSLDLKFSDKVKKAFTKAGKVFDENLEKAMKVTLANKVISSNIEDVFSKDVIDNFKVLCENIFAYYNKK